MQFMLRNISIEDVLWNLNRFLTARLNRVAPLPCPPNQHPIDWFRFTTRTHKEAQTQINTHDDIFPLKKIHLSPNPRSQNGTSPHLFLCCLRQRDAGGTMWCGVGASAKREGRTNERIVDHHRRACFVPEYFTTSPSFNSCWDFFGAVQPHHTHIASHRIHTT